MKEPISSRESDMTSSVCNISTEAKREVSWRPASSVVGISQSAARKLAKLEEIRGVILPWNKYYKLWWVLTVIGAIITLLLEPFHIAFEPGGLIQANDDLSILEYVLTSIFVIDIGIHFRLAYFNEDSQLICDQKMITKKYLRKMFIIDVLGVFPFYALVLALAGLIGRDNSTSQSLAFFRLIKLVRVHRVKHLFDILQYHAKVSLAWFTVIRNFAAAFVWSHFSACTLFFIARQYSFNLEKTWIGSENSNLTTFERYVTSLYWAVVTFATVGYGDYSPVNAMEQVWGIVYMLLNIIISSWIIGSMTLLIVKQAEKTGSYRDALRVLKEYCHRNYIDRDTLRSLKVQLKLGFQVKEFSDDQVLKQFPSGIQRKVLRKLYLSSLLQSDLMSHTKQQFVDTFLSLCTVEMYGPGEELMSIGSTCSRLYLLVDGTVTCCQAGFEDFAIDGGKFINDVAFFSESPQMFSVCTKSVCKTLTISKSSYRKIAEDFPASADKVLQNLLEESRMKMQEMASRKVKNSNMSKFKRSPPSRSKTPSDVGFDSQPDEDQDAFLDINYLIKLSISKKEDDNITKFLFAASRGDTAAIAFMCEHGFDPNSSDYDRRTALMVAAMKGNTDTAKLLLDFQADPNVVDVHGTSALYEAAVKGNEDTMDLLISNGAKLGIKTSLAASILCQSVFDGDILTLRHLLRAGIDANAADYDRRTAAHLAAAEGNAAAIKVLVEFGANLNAKDRWNHSVWDEARQSGSKPLLSFLATLQE